MRQQASNDAMDEGGSQVARAPEFYHFASTNETYVFENPQADIPADGDTTMAHVRVEGGLTIEVPTGTEAFLLGLRGEGEVDGQAIGAHMATALRAGPVALRGAAFDALIGWSAPMPRAPRFQGPFCMFSPDRLAEAQRRAQTGGMGALSPSKVAWARG